jgi:hypothetical protein
MRTRYLAKILGIDFRVLERELALFPTYFQTSEPKKVPCEAKSVAHLHLAVLIEATRHIKTSRRTNRHSRLYKDALDWLNSPESHAFTFEACCNLWNLDASAVRESILSEEFTEKRRESLSHLRP